MLLPWQKDVIFTTRCRSSCFVLQVLNVLDLRRDVWTQLLGLYPAWQNRQTDCLYCHCIFFFFITKLMAALMSWEVLICKRLLTCDWSVASSRRQEGEQLVWLLKWYIFLFIYFLILRHHNVAYNLKQETRYYMNIEDVNFLQQSGLPG